MTIITQQSFRNGNSEQKNVKVHRKSVSVLALCNNLLSEQMWRMDTIVSFWLLKTIWSHPNLESGAARLLTNMKISFERGKGCWLPMAGHLQRVYNIFPLFNLCTPWLAFAPGLQHYFQLLIEYESLAQVIWAEISGTRHDLLGRLFLSAKASLPWSVVFSLCSTVHNSRWGQR